MSISKAKATRCRLGLINAAVGFLTAVLIGVAARPASASFDVSLSADTNPVADGQTVKLTTSVTNNGPAQYVLLWIRLGGEGERGSGLLYLSSEPTGLGSCTGTYLGSSSVSCFGVIEGGCSATLVVEAQAEGSGGPVTVTALVEGSGSSNTAQTILTVSAGNQVQQEEEGSDGLRGGAGQPTGSQPNTTVCVVPKLSGKTLAAAKKLLGKARCKLGKVTKKKSKGKVRVVVSQKPKAGSRLRAGSTVSLVLRRH